MATTSRDSLEAQVATFFSTLQELRTDSPPDAFEAFGRLFDENCVANPTSMREHLAAKVGRQEILNAYKEDLKLCHLVKRRVVSQLLDEKQRIASCEMKNSLLVNGYPLDPFYETAIIKFNEEGLIISLNVYNCRSPIVALLQKSTGLGPYSDVDREVKELELIK